MKFFKQTTIRVIVPTGDVLNSTDKIIDTENDGSVDSVLDLAARNLQAESWSVYWAFDEKSFKAVHNADERITCYVTVKEL
jgi:hypothetical protein